MRCIFVQEEKNTINKLNICSPMTILLHNFCGEQLVSGKNYSVYSLLQKLPFFFFFNIGNVKTSAVKRIIPSSSLQESWGTVVFCHTEMLRACVIYANINIYMYNKVCSATERN